MNEFTKTAIFAAQKAGEILKDNAFSDLNVKFKGEIDLVTRMDIESEKIIVNILKEKFPDHDIVSEEGDIVKRKSEFVWYIDPLDGTTNYAHRLPWYAVSIGLHKNEEPISGVILNPANGEIFYAEKGEGAFLNKEKIHVSDQANPGESFLTTGFPYYIRKKSSRVIKNFDKFVVIAQGIRRFGAAALDLAYVSCGRYEGFWEEGLKPWDCAAGILLIKEAGGVVSDYWGRDFDIFGSTITASNGKIHNFMIDILKESER